MTTQDNTNPTLTKHYTVLPTEAGMRIDRYLTHLQLDTRSQIQKWITKGEVKVNGQAVVKHYEVQAEDVITISHVAVVKITPQPLPPIPILFEDDHILVLEKPTGIVVHPAPGLDELTLVDFVRQHYPPIAEVGEDPIRPGIIHRLDRDVSGVLVVAKTQEAFLNLKSQFMNRTVHKEYRAIVHGVPQEVGVIRFAIAPSKTHPGRMAARPQHQEGKEAWTEYTRLRTRNQRYAELAITIKTGRTHQIRAHFTAIDHPIVGDTLYTSKRYHSEKEYPRLFLHAHRLIFIHPATDNTVEYISPIPAEFEAFLSA